MKTITLNWELSFRAGTVGYCHAKSRETGALVNPAEESWVEGDGDPRQLGHFQAAIEVDDAVTGWHIVYMLRTSNDSIAAWGYADLSGADGAAASVEDVALSVSVDQEQLEDAIGAGFESITFPDPMPLTLVYGEVIPRTFTFKGEAYLHEIGTNSIQAVSRANGVIAPQSLTSIASLSLKIVDAEGNAVQYVPNASLDRSQDAQGKVSWTNNEAMTSSLRNLQVFLFNDAGDLVIVAGEMLIKYAPENAA